MTEYKLNEISADPKHVLAIAGCLLHHGYKSDPRTHGHPTYKKTFSNGTTRRIQFKGRTIRCDTMVRHAGTEYSKPSVSWVRLWQATYKNVGISRDTGKLKITKQVSF